MTPDAHRVNCAQQIVGHKVADTDGNGQIVVREAGEEEEESDALHQIFDDIDGSLVLDGSFVVAVDERDESAKKEVAEQIVSKRFG